MSHSILLSPGVRDLVRIRETGQHRHILGFYAMADETFITRTGAQCEHRALRPVHGNSAELAVITTRGGLNDPPDFHRPFDLEWEKPMDATNTDEVISRRTFLSLIGSPRYSVQFTDRSYPDVFARLSLLSAHERLKIAAWRRETSQRMMAFHGVSA